VAVPAQTTEWLAAPRARNGRRSVHDADRRGAVRTVAIVGGAANRTNPVLAAAWRRFGISARQMTARSARGLLQPGDVALGRLDVTAELDGVEPGLLDLLLLERSGVEVLNAAEQLVRVHDKLRTARALARAGLPTPETALVRTPGDPVAIPPPVVVKPRFGSWGRDVRLCPTDAVLRTTLRSLAGRPWFRRHGAVVQELVPHPGHDLRLVVAGGRVVGAVARRAAPGEWRTNASLGGSIVPAQPEPRARALAEAAAAALGMALVGVDLVHVPSDRYVVIELNGAVDFDERYSLQGGEVFYAAAAALGLLDDHLVTPWPGSQPVQGSGALR
jgi:RimK family alpha-L-glutamate ligase